MTATETPKEATVNYAQEVLDELAERLPDCDTGLLELYALLALTRGGGTTLENVHDAWSIWRSRTRPDHPSLIPFIMLTPEVRELDRKYADAIRGAAAELVLGGVPDPEPDPEPPLPGGIFGRVELPGYRQHTGWITEEPRFGQQMAVVRDWDGREVAMAALGPGCQVVVLPTPRKRPEVPKAITAGAESAAYADDEDWSDDDDDDT